MNAGFNALRKGYSQLKSDLRQVKRTAALLAGLRDFLREPITLARAKDEIGKVLDNREERFLEMAGTQIYQRPGSPYLKLLKRAGCEFPDLRAQVYHHGLDRKSTRLNSSHSRASRMPSSA